ncbi:MAG: histidine kinase [Leptolyngbya sp. DLM2.Bin15]|nr:MAG: histidine kinase [Leptolyngbya sp. DLM2.Bin15]
MNVVPFQPIRYGLILSLGLGLSVISAVFVGRWEVSKQQVRFQRQIENISTALQRSLNRYTDVLSFIDDYYKTAEGTVSRQDFSRFVERSLITYPGIQALEWAPMIQQTERLAFEQRIQAEGYPDFQLTELSHTNQLIRAGDRPYYIPVVYLEPFANNEAAFGFDLNSTADRTIALESARDTNRITATGRIRLVQEQRDQFGFLMVLPLYDTPLPPQSLSDRRDQFTGFLVGVFRVSDVVEESLQDLRYDIHVALYDQSAQPDQQFLGRYDALEQQVITRESDRASLGDSSLCANPLDCTHVLSVGERQWRAVFSPSINYTSSVNYSAPVTFFVGLLLTTSLLLFLHQLTAELERTRTLSDLKLRFFSMASHELRTPLSTILLSIESLQLNHHQLSEQQQQTNIQRIYLTAKRMSQQVSDLLTLTRAEVGKQDYTPELVEIYPLVQHIIADMEEGDRPRIVLTASNQQDKAFWDKRLVRSLLSNLLSNALKYSPMDSPVQVTLSSDDHRAILTVSDRGIGIPAADQAQIWDAFYRGHNVGAIVGSGLGLAVVKTCVELHRGTWAIESQEGQGTMVTVILPLE